LYSFGIPSGKIKLFSSKLKPRNQKEIANVHWLEYGEIAVNTSTTTTSDYLLDCGATHSVTNNSTELLNFQPLMNKYVVLGDKRTLPIRGYGDLKFGKLLLRNILYVPDIQVKLIATNTVLSFHNVLKIVMNLNTADIITTTGTITCTKTPSDLYKLPAEETQPQLNFTTMNALSHLMHQIYGHPSDEVLKKLGFHRTKEEKSVPCLACVKGKSCQVYKSRSNYETEILGRLHADGIHLPPSFDGFMYALVFLDEAGKKGWMRAIRNKSEFLRVMKELHNVVTTQVSLKLIRLRTDVGGELKSIDIRKFCAENGVTHEVTPPTSIRPMVWWSGSIAPCWTRHDVYFST
jgi:hypothetical protein